MDSNNFTTTRVYTRMLAMLFNDQNRHIPLDLPSADAGSIVAVILLIG